MRLQRLRVEQLRQFRQPFELAGLAPGLNLFAGPNEAGKSTLVRAIRAAFFERHRSASVDDLLPWGEPSAAPTVELDFSVGGADYRLRKSFMHRKRCELQAGAQQLDGEEAEQHLAELLGFRFAGKGASRPEHWGIPGLLWIEQGGAQDITEPVGNATDHLRKALEQSVSEVASSQGDDVIDRVRAERERLLTSTARPRGAYAEAIGERDVANARVAELDARIVQYRHQVDQLGQMRAEHAADAGTRPWEDFRARQQEAAGQLAAIDALKARIDGDATSLKRLDDNLALVEEQIAGYDVQQRALGQRASELEQAERRLAAAASAETPWTLARRAAQAACERADFELALARQEELRDGLLRRQNETQARVASLADVLARASAELEQLHALRRLAVESELARADLVRLREQHARIAELRIRQEAAATRVVFDIAPDSSVMLGGQRLFGAGEKLVTAAAELDLGSAGRLQIIPGGADLADLAREQERQQALQLGLLQRLGVPDLDAAEARFANHQQALKDIVHGEKALANLAPRGLDGLRGELGETTARSSEAGNQLAQLPAPPDGRPAPLLEPAITQQKAANVHLERITQQALDAQQALNTARTQRDAAHREHATLQDLLNDPARRQRERELGRKMLLVRSERDTLQLRIRSGQGEVEQARPDILAQDVERFRRSAEQAERAFGERQTSMTLLQGKLEEAGAQGLEEERAEQAVRAQAATRRCAEVKLRADALDLLFNLLQSRRSELTRRLQAPLHKHVDHYLQLLFPGASLDIGENLAPGQLTRVGNRGAESGPVHNLSFGAREQMGVISRLAYADLLKEAGRPTLVILDDALVHSDDQRLAQMKRVLFDAAQRHQVLLFTCHPAAWRDMGAAPRVIAVADADGASRPA